MKITTRAKTARSEVRKAAKKDADLAAMIDAEITQIDAETEQRRAALGSKIYVLKLPTLNTVIQQVRAPPVVKEETPDPEALAAAADPQCAEARADAAERDASIAVCDAERAAKSMQRLGPCPTPG